MNNPSLPEIRFYHFDRAPQDQIIPPLLLKAFESGRRVVLKLASQSDLDHFNEHLWVFDAHSFLPHGSPKEGHADRQPVWLTLADENPNAAEVLVLAHGVETQMYQDFSLVCFMLDGRDSDATARARGLWKNFKEQGFAVTYWQQGAKGWENKG